jgi:hypothetical protein
VNLASRSRIKNRDWAAYSPSGHLDADIDQLDQPRYRLGHEHPEIRVACLITSDICWRRRATRRSANLAACAGSVGGPVTRSVVTSVVTAAALRGAWRGTR